MENYPIEGPKRIVGAFVDELYSDTFEQIKREFDKAELYKNGGIVGDKAKYYAVTRFIHILVHFRTRYNSLWEENQNHEQGKIGTDSKPQQPVSDTSIGHLLEEECSQDTNTSKSLVYAKFAEGLQKSYQTNHTTSLKRSSTPFSFKHQNETINECSSGIKKINLDSSISSNSSIETENSGTTAVKQRQRSRHYFFSNINEPQQHLISVLLFELCESVLESEYYWLKARHIISEWEHKWNHKWNEF